MHILKETSNKHFLSVHKFTHLIIHIYLGTNTLQVQIK